MAYSWLVSAVQVAGFGELLPPKAPPSERPVGDGTFERQIKSIPIIYLMMNYL